ncbi:Serine-threonine protein kinase [Moritella viscosa]|uniref:protein kinase domain-containing protein n=1 Tax=Moritella viscosa TaxID=80854 RepID=UPI0005090141|nr:protein kinase [Moritella viscosa]CED60751.1 putative type VI secretion protein kinase [Moritella viscosa]SHO11918.1 Serine-threonine protein kinase [Moritella viscosa]SHO22975.1 Serine-threonine protein kinase [Moritella viscosa]
MSEVNNVKTDFINSVIVKAIEKKKKKSEEIERANQPKLEDVLSAKFDILDKITSPTSSTVTYHLAKKGQPDKQVCCKTIANTSNESAKRQILAEASCLEISQHPTVARFIKVGSEFNTPYFMYEWVQGESIAKKVSRYSGKGFRHDHIAWLIYQLAGALEYMHTKGVCHLDIKPSNIIVDEDDAVKLIDFGAAQYVNESNGYAEASRGYASPLFIDSGVGEPQDDVYSLAVVTYYLFVGATPNSNLSDDITNFKCTGDIPPHIWRLLNSVFSSPRSHGLTPINFAQNLAKIDINSKSLSGMPIFNSLRNADLVLTQTSRDETYFWLSGRYVGISSVLGLTLLLSIILSYGLVAINNKAENELYENFINLENSTRDRIEAASYLEAEKQYADNKNIIVQNQSYPVEQLRKLREIKRQVVDLRQQFSDPIVPIPTVVNTSLIKLLANVNTLISATRDINGSFGISIKQAIGYLEKGDSESIIRLNHDALLSAKVNNFYYSKEFHKELIKAVMERVEELESKSKYTSAIKLLDQIVNYLGPFQIFTEKRQSLIIARSEYILFKTATGKYIYSNTKIKKAYEDLEKMSPERALEVRLLLTTIVANTLSKKYISKVTLDGASNIDKLLIKLNNNEQTL